MKKTFSILCTIMFSLSLTLMPVVFVGAQQGQTGADGQGAFDPNGQTGADGQGTFDPNAGTGNLSGTFSNPLNLPGINTISEFIRVILENIVIPIGAVVSVFFIIYAGFLYVVARGNPAAISKAHQALLNALIGTVIILGSWAISKAIEGTVDQLRQGL